MQLYEAYSFCAYSPLLPTFLPPFKWAKHSIELLSADCIFPHQLVLVVLTYEHAVSPVASACRGGSAALLLRCCCLLICRCCTGQHVCEIKPCFHNRPLSPPTCAPNAKLAVLTPLPADGRLPCGVKLVKARMLILPNSAAPDILIF